MKNLKLKAVITTINKPNQVYANLSSELGESEVIIIGDAKTPKEWECITGFISLDGQNKLFKVFSEKLPINHYSRKNMGYLMAIAERAEAIYETDDDTFLRNGKIIQDFVEEYLYVEENEWINVYKYFTNRNIWPRGLPLRKIESTPLPKFQYSSNEVAITQFLVDGDPDVDAIYRMIGTLPFYFEESKKISLRLIRGAKCPYNSQNTIHFPVAYPFLYLPAYVSFRMTDIWRSIISQTYLQYHGYAIEFRPPNSIQSRNAHDLIKDLKQEIDGYKYNELIAEICTSNLHKPDPLKYLINVYKDLHKEKIVIEKEIELVSHWVEILNEHISL